ncbi:hypothetical protein HZS_2555 [Henneguya salminicola]|nr:hypothetical protein HZS_2555 [Henneguya salminicola]
MFSYQTKKGILYVLNFVLMIAGIIIILFGYGSKVERNKFTPNYKYLRFDFSTNIMIAGFIFFIVCFFGAVGTLRENTNLLTIKWGIAVWFKIIFISFRSAPYHVDLCNRDWIIVLHEGTMVLSMRTYLLNFTLYLVNMSNNGHSLNFHFKRLGIFNIFIKAIKPVQNLILDDLIKFDPSETTDSLVNIIQMLFQCCGAYSYKDWENNKLYACANTGEEKASFACSVPFTCCFASTGFSLNCGEDALKNETKDRNIYTLGCVQRFENLLDASQYYFVILIGVLIFFEFIILTTVQKNLSYINWLKKQIECLL